MQRKVIFLDPKTKSAPVMPITPKTIQASNGINFETINIHTMGNVNIAGYKVPATIKMDLMFPAQYYPFVVLNVGVLPKDPYSYVALFQRYETQQTVLRFIVTGTPTNIPVQVESLEHREQDGTNDIYATLTLREYRDLQTQQQNKPAAAKDSKSRPAAAGSTKMQYHVVKSGDTLSGICLKYYGDCSATMYNKLAKYNGIKNPNLIYDGNTIKIPPKSAL
ncbi:MAG: LysM peptidoglycan-binding domain-containing protein [Ruminococcaceae bacterium]|nr:LysM peptidoglycan-binding domain-containing protein [Oscillospiraceae bacterium]